MRHALTLEELHGVLDLDLATGVFTWKLKQSNAVPAGAKAGTLKPNGRVYINLFGDAYLAHRLAWFYVKGEWPKGAIRQRDGDLSSARFDNLYEATVTEVNVGRRLGKNNTSGRVGVTYNKRRKKWRAQIKRDWKPIDLGYFGTFEEACAARTAAEESVGTVAGQEYERHVEHETMRRRQRVAWRVVKDEFGDCSDWIEFGAFAADVGEPPGPRYLIGRLDDDQNVGPDNFCWIAPPSERYDLKTSAGRQAYKKDQDANQRYGFKSHAEKLAYFAEHGGCCESCGIAEGEKYVAQDGETKTARIVLDHDHVSGDRRGLLCDRCNFAEGSLRSELRNILRLGIYRTGHLREGELARALPELQRLVGIYTMAGFNLIRKESA